MLRNHAYMHRSRSRDVHLAMKNIPDLEQEESSNIKLRKYCICFVKS